jgi:hypothetical protein
MDRSRCLLHKNQLKDFQLWLHGNGWSIYDTKGHWEVLRAKRDKDWLFIYDRIPGDHYTVFGIGIKQARLFHKHIKIQKGIVDNHKD